MAEARHNVIPFKRPASDSSGDDNSDWLRELSFEDRFLCKKKASISYTYDSYGVSMVLPEAVLLFSFNSDNPNKFEWVDSKKFSKQHLLITVLPKIEQGGTLHDQYLLSPPGDGEDDGPDEGSVEVVHLEEQDGEV